ncbi:MAG: hypothetical protein M3Y08_14055 [Fibrobacterota bacterium]|nr:hypothetical protein [Fibrobacterota bacterium]
MRNRIHPAFFTTLSVAAALAFTGCNTDPVTDNVPDVNLPTKSEIDDAKLRVGISSEALTRAHAALEFLGIIPVYTCGEERAHFAGRLPANLATGFAGAAFTLDATDPTADKVSIVFPAAGSKVRGHKVTGNFFIKTSGGKDRFTLELDARQAKIDGKAVQTVAGYGTCGDSTSYWADSEGPLPTAGQSYVLMAKVGKKAGISVIGSTTLLVDATGSMTHDGKTDQVTLTSMDYEVGKLLPHSGTLLIITSSEKRILATFSQDTPIAGQVKVRVDSKSAVTIPLPGY